MQHQEFVRNTVSDKYRIGFFHVFTCCVSKDSCLGAFAGGPVHPNERAAGRPPHDEAAVAKPQDLEEAIVETIPKRGQTV